jgi:hypothetical protein
VDIPMQDTDVAREVKPSGQTIEQWLEAEIYELEANRSSGGFSIHLAGQITMAKRVLDHIRREKELA